MKVVLHRSASSDFPYQKSLPPLGLGYVAAYLKKRCWFAEVTYCHTTEEILSSRPDVVGISSASENFNEAIDTATRVKEAMNVPIFIGGVHISLLPLTLPKCFDVGILCEGEHTIVDLINLYKLTAQLSPTELSKIPGICYHDGNEVAVTGERELIGELDEIPYPDREVLGFKWEMSPSREIHMVTSRGCPYKCIFCASSKLWKRFRYFSPEYVAEEIDFIRQTYDPECIYFFDDLFVANPARFRQICKLIKQRRLHEGIRFRTYARVNLVDTALADLFREMNFFYIDFGFESNVQSTLDYLNKQHASPEKNQRAIDLLHKRGISIGANVIIACPEETVEDIMETYRFLEHNKDKIDRASFAPLIPLPGTPVWEYAREQGIVSEWEIKWSRLRFDPHRTDLNAFPLLSKKVDREQLVEIVKTFRDLCREIELVGQVKEYARRLAQVRDRLSKLEYELSTIHGSKLFKTAWFLRNFMSRLWGRKDIRNTVK